MVQAAHQSLCLCLRCEYSPLRNAQCSIQSLTDSRTVFALMIINKAGGLIYNRTFQEGLNQLSSNDYLVIAGTFHG